MTRYEQDFCSRCEKKCNPKELVSLVCGRAAHPGSPKYTTILLICGNCTESFLKWLTWPTEHDLTFRDNFSDNAKEEMR